MILNRVVRALLALLLCWALTMPAQASTAVTVDDFALLLDENGSVLVEPGTYRAIRRLGGTGLFSAKRAEDGKILLLREDGTPLTDLNYLSAASWGTLLLLDEGGGSYPAGPDAAPLTHTRYSRLVPFGGSCFAFKTSVYDDIADELYVLQSDGTEADSGVRLFYADIAPAEGLCAAMNAENGLYGYLNEEGAWAIEPQFLSAGAFLGGSAVVGVPSGMGLIDAQGEWLLSPLYRDMRLSPRFVICTESDALFVYERTGEGLMMRWISEDGFAAPLGEYFAVYGEEQTLLLSAEGEILEEFPPDVLLEPGQAEQVILFDEAGACVFDCLARTRTARFDHVARLDAENLYLCALYAGGSEPYRLGAMDKNGTMLLQAEYQSLVAAENGLLAARDGENLLLFRLEQGEAFLLARIETATIKGENR